MAELIRIFREGDPRISLMEVKMAMRIAETEVRSEFGGRINHVALWTVFLIGLAAASFGFWLLIGRSGFSDPVITSLPLIVMAILALIVVVFAVFLALRR